jgi:transposase-like protein
MAARRLFTPEFRNEAIAASLAAEESREETQKQLAARLDIHPSVLQRWVRDYRKNPKRAYTKKAIATQNAYLPSPPDTTPTNESKELKNLRIERDLLKGLLAHYMGGKP